MIGERVQKAINEQIQAEIQSAYLYLSMAAYFSSKDLDGMAHWMRAQTQEELIHAMKFMDHLVARDGRIELLEIEKPKVEWESPLEAFREAYKHEQYVTSRINDLVKLAAEENDNAAAIMLQWFVTEQVEEEASTAKVAQDLERAGSAGQALLMLDQELSARVSPITLPTPQA